MAAQHTAETNASLTVHIHPLAEQQSPKTENGRKKGNPPVSYALSVLFDWLNNEITCCTKFSACFLDCKVESFHGIMYSLTYRELFSVLVC